MTYTNKVPDKTPEIMDAVHKAAITGFGKDYDRLSAVTLKYQMKPILSWLERSKHNQVKFKKDGIELRTFGSKVIQGLTYESLIIRISVIMPYLISYNSSADIQFFIDEKIVAKRHRFLWLSTFWFLLKAFKAKPLLGAIGTAVGVVILILSIGSIIIGVVGVFAQAPIFAALLTVGLIGGIVSIHGIIKW